MSLSLSCREFVIVCYVSESPKNSRSESSDWNVKNVLLGWKRLLGFLSARTNLRVMIAGLNNNRKGEHLINDKVGYYYNKRMGCRRPTKKRLTTAIVIIHLVRQALTHFCVFSLYRNVLFLRFLDNYMPHAASNRIFSTRTRLSNVTSLILFNEQSK